MKLQRDKNEQKAAERRARDAERKRNNLKFNTIAGERARARDRERYQKSSEKLKKDSNSFNLRTKSDPYPRNGTAEFQLGVITHASTYRFVDICSFKFCQHPVDRSKEYCTGLHPHQQPRDRESRPCVPVKLTSPTDPNQTYMAAIIDRRVARTLYGGVDVLDPDHSDTKQMLLLKAFKEPIKTWVTTSHIGCNTFIVGLPALDPPYNLHDCWKYWQYHFSASIKPMIYSPLELRLWHTNDPIITNWGYQNGPDGRIPVCTKIPICTVELVSHVGEWPGIPEPDEVRLAAIIDDDVFNKLPFSDKLGSPLSQAAIPQLTNFLATVMDACVVEVTVVEKHGEPIITRLTHLLEKEKTWRWFERDYTLR